jgi:cytoskeleton protein RodZ
MSDNKLSVTRNNFGDLLREAREAKGFSLEYVADRIKVRPSLLQLVEAAKFEELPEAIYARSYIQKFAEIVGLEAAPFVATFDANSGRATFAATADMKKTLVEARAKPATVTPVVSTPTKPSGFNPLPWVIGAVAALAVGAGAFVMLQRNQTPTAAGTMSSQEAERLIEAAQARARATANSVPGTTSGSQSTVPRTATIQNSATTAPAPVTPGTVRLSVNSKPEGATVYVDGFRVGITPLKEALVSSGANRELKLEKPGFKTYAAAQDLQSNRNLSVALEKGLNTPTATPTANGKIQLVYRGSSWTRIRRGGQVLFEGTPRPGQKLEFDAPIEVRLGAPSLVSAVINGETRERLGGSSAATLRLP